MMVAAAPTECHVYIRHVAALTLGRFPGFISGSKQLSKAATSKLSLQRKEKKKQRKKE